VNTKLLGIYLNDHLAGSIVGGELAKRAASQNQGSELGEFLGRLVREIEEERSVLVELLEHFGEPKNRFKPPLAWVGEKAGRLKLNGQLTGYSPLSRVVELEGLMLGVTGKLGMWRVLASLDANLERFGIDRLITQAEAQRDALDRYRLDATRLAFEDAGSRP
jgi:hypothetical protein